MCTPLNPYMYWWISGWWATNRQTSNKSQPRDKPKKLLLHNHLSVLDSAFILAASHLLRVICIWEQRMYIRRFCQYCRFYVSIVADTWVRSPIRVDIWRSICWPILHVIFLIHRERLVIGEWWAHRVALIGIRVVGKVVWAVWRACIRPSDWQDFRPPFDPPYASKESLRWYIPRNNHRLVCHITSNSVYTCTTWSSVIHETPTSPPHWLISHSQSLIQEHIKG
jgi:hypothetical protein